MVSPGLLSKYKQPSKWYFVTTLHVCIMHVFYMELYYGTSLSAEYI